ncbi:MAG: DUF4157 domain-containing protein [Chloroflexi bacterium]|nr:DUF4157 domain-containing protein [Chloroflexota bacterium]
MSQRQKADKQPQPSRAPVTSQNSVTHVQQGYAVPPAVHDVLRAPGQPLDDHTRSFMESRFDHDFSGVRVHSDARATRSARSIGARAYTAGVDIVFGTGNYAPYTQAGRHLLGHELAHIVQGNGQRVNQPGIDPGGERYETNADQAAATVLNYTPFPILAGAPPAIRLVRDPNLNRYLNNLRASAAEFRQSPYSTNGLVDIVLERLEGLDLTDQDNLIPVVETLSAIQFPGEAFTLLMVRIDAMTRASGQMTALERVRLEQEHQRRIEMLQNMTAPRRGPYGTRGPGVMLPVMAGAFAGIFESLSNLFRSAAGFVRGVITGFREAMSPQDTDRLVRKLGESAILNLIFPIVFVAGAVVGIVEDIVRAIQSIYETVVNFDEVMAAATELIRTMLSEQGEEVGEAMGAVTGREYAQKVRTMLNQNIFAFTYNLGRIIGPTVVYAVLSLLGLPVIASIVGVSARAISTFGAIIRRIPGLRRLRALLRLRRQRRLGSGGGGGGTPGALAVAGGRVRFTLADLLRWESLGGHALQRHGPFHTRDTLLRRILNETSLGGPPPSRTLPGGVRTTDFRVWRGDRKPHASSWSDNDTMLRALDDLINDNIDEIQSVTSRGGRVVLERHDLSRPVGRGWVTALRGTAGERGIFWTDDLRHATVVIDPHPGGGWYVVTAFPEL